MKENPTKWNQRKSSAIKWSLEMLYGKSNKHSLGTQKSLHRFGWISPNVFTCKNNFFFSFLLLLFFFFLLLWWCEIDIRHCGKVNVWIPVQESTIKERHTICIWMANQMHWIRLILIFAALIHKSTYKLCMNLAL